MNTPPRLEYYGDREKSVTLKGKALNFYQFVLGSMYGVRSIVREAQLDEGTVIQASITTDAYDNCTGVIRIYVAPIESGDEPEFYIHVSVSGEKDIDSSAVSRVYSKGFNASTQVFPFDFERNFDLDANFGGLYWFNSGSSIHWAYRFDIDGLPAEVSYKGYNVIGLALAYKSNVLCCKARGKKIFTLETETTPVTEEIAYSVCEYSVEVDALSQQFLSAHLDAKKIIINSMFNPRILSSFFLKNGKSIIFLSIESTDVASPNYPLFFIGLLESEDGFVTHELTNIIPLSYSEGGTGNFEAMYCHGDDFVLVTRKFSAIGYSDSPLLAYWYDKNAKSFYMYEELTVQLNAMQQLQYISKKLDMKVMLTYAPDPSWSGSPYLPTPAVLTVTVSWKGVDTVILEDISTYPTNFLSPSEGRIEVDDALRKSANDGKRLAIGFHNHPIAMSQDFQPDRNKAWALIIDTSSTDSLVYQIEKVYDDATPTSFHFSAIGISITPKKREL